jgi:hypothetical protein
MSKPRTPKKTTKPARAPAPPAPAAAVDPAERAYTLEDNLARTGPSTPDELSAFIEGYTDDELVAAGAAVDTSRIDVDAARLIGQAIDFYQRATAEQRGHLRGVSRTMLRAMAWAAVQGHDAYLALHTGLTELRSTRYARRETSVSLASRGHAELVQLAEALRALAAGHAATIARIEHAAVQSHHADGLPAAIEELVKIGRAMLAKPSKAMLVRLADGEAGVSNDWLDACQDLARQIRDAGLTAQAPLPVMQLSQADVDRWDGINLALLRQLIRLFEAGHRVDPSIPRLVPLSLRAVFGHRKHKPGAAKEPAAAAQPPGAPQPV